MKNGAANQPTNSSEECVQYILGYKPYPLTHGPYFWSKEWFPDWFLKIEDCFEKVVLPYPNIRLDYLLNKNKYIALFNQQKASILDDTIKLPIIHTPNPVMYFLFYLSPKSNKNEQLWKTR